MAIGKRRRERQLDAFAAASDLPKSPGHSFFTVLNRLLTANGFDPLAVRLCEPYYAETVGDRASRRAYFSGRSSTAISKC